MKKITTLVLILCVILIIGCGQNANLQSSTNTQTTINNNQNSKTLPEIKPVNVQGKLGEEISDNHVKIKVLDYGPVENVDGRDYLSLKISVENLGDDNIDIYKNFKIFGSLTDNYGQKCGSELVDKHSDIVLPLKLGPKQKAEGILPCPILIDESGKLNSLNLMLEFSDDIPFEKQSQYAPGSKYGDIKVNVYSYNEIKGMLAASGSSGQEVGTKMAWNSIKVNSHQLLNGIGTLGDYSSKKYIGGQECGEDWFAYEDLAQKQKLISVAETTYSHCQFLKLGITVKNKGYFEHTSDPAGYKVGITNLKANSGTTDGFNYRRIHETAFNQLDTPINLKDMKPGEERTGNVIYSITKYIDLVGGVEKNSMFKYSYGAELKSSLQ